MATDPVPLLSRALDQAGDVVAGTDRGRAGDPTPCRSWTVGQLVDHLVHDLGQFVTAAGGGAPDWSQAPPPAGDDWAGAYRRGAQELVEAWQKAGDLSGTVTLPGMGEVPARFPVDMQIAELAVHAWDLATATGQRVDLDPEVAETALAWMRGTMAPQFRGTEEEGKAFGPEVPIADDAPAYDRLAAFAGRRPADPAR
jgi:uncharacterized protein (TIGR03086 family)